MEATAVGQCGTVASSQSEAAAHKAAEREAATIDLEGKQQWAYNY